MSDGELVRQTLAGRSQAYEELVRRWAGRITAMCHAKVGRAPEAEDLAQEALLRGFRSLSSLAEPEKFGSWLFGIAVHACLDCPRACQQRLVLGSSSQRPGGGLLEQAHRVLEAELEPLVVD